MGLSPRQVDDLSLWEFAACVDGWIAANGGDEEQLSDADIRALSNFVDESPVWLN